MSSNTCKCPHHKILPIAIILIALAFLLSTLGVVNPMYVAIAWPVLIIIAMIPKLGTCKCCSNH
ncbi:MAG: hypothetical protein ABA06_03870 [Parcubacteria bacterium C7867-001]|nr:MAG: hypothetical protein ABA06_03870 [Parcubacteria bacterium C7867-001]